MIRYPAKLPQGIRLKGYNQYKDLMPTVMELAGLSQDDIQWASDLRFDGRSLLPMVHGEVTSHESEFYITECTYKTRSKYEVEALIRPAPRVCTRPRLWSHWSDARLLPISCWYV